MTTHLLCPLPMSGEKIKEFREKMNRMAGKAEPFLFIVDFGVENAVLIPLEKCGAEGILFDVEGNKNSPEPQIQEPVVLTKHPVVFQKYLQSFQYVQKNIRQGNSYLVNLTFPTAVDAGLSLKEIYLRASAKYKLLYKDEFLVFSPESFIKISQGKIFTFPMKGTIDASLRDAEGLLLRNEKETAEHATIVDLLRNDLSIVAKNVTVEKYRYIEKIRTSGKDLLQMSSVISGDLPQDYLEKTGDILLSLLPAGSISGAPKKATLEIIAKAENYKRGFYTGVFGIFDGKNLNSAVMIRFIENDNGRLIYKSGGGITSKSNPDEEYRELIDKIYVPVH